MNTRAGSLYESPVAPQRTSSTTIPPLQQLVWSIRRELWENRSLYIAPLIAAGVVLLGFLIAVIRLAHRTDLPPTLEAARQNHAMVFPYDIAAGIIMLTAGIVSIFYCLDALHGECRDRSILFWKSLPVSDLTTVLAKVSIPLLILPMVAFAITVATQIVMLLLSSCNCSFPLLPLRSRRYPCASTTSGYTPVWTEGRCKLCQTGSEPLR